VVQHPHRTKRYRSAKILHSCSFLRLFLCCCELSRIVVVVSRRIKKGFVSLRKLSFVGVFLIRESLLLWSAFAEKALTSKRARTHDNTFCEKRRCFACCYKFCPKNQRTADGIKK
jgi:hypothetical protein